MKICVLMKQVPDKDSSIKIALDNLSIDQNIVSFTTNESDSYALEEALQEASEEAFLISTKSLLYAFSNRLLSNRLIIFFPSKFPPELTL